MNNPICDCGEELEIGFDNNAGYWVECSECCYKSNSSHDLDFVVRHSEIRKIGVDTVQEKP